MSLKPQRPNRLKKGRDQRPKRRLRLGGYLIITDSEKTEENYFKGLRESIPAECSRDLQIKIFSKRELKHIVHFAEQERNRDERFRNVWLIFDRDEVPDFNDIIAQAEDANMHVGWSNPCFEIWLSAYFGEMKPSPHSKGCIADFAKLLRKYTGKEEYHKSEEILYKLLLESGDEKRAIEIANRRYNQRKREYRNPSDMKACTTVFQLVQEIREKTDPLKAEG
jgi:hypothetical protein